MKHTKNLQGEELYLDLLKKCLTRYIFDDGYLNLFYRKHGKTKHLLYSLISTVLDKFDLELVKHNQFDPKLRETGKDWPATAETMIGLARLDNIQHCMTNVLSHNIPGDFIETGAWRGGATIFMRAVLKAYNITDRTVWVADSFQGLPKPTARSHKQDREDQLWAFQQLTASLQEVKANFAKYELLDGQVQFLKGWFKDTLPTAPIKQLALLRLDGDMYESTMDALRALYPKLAKGGYVIVDDYCLPACREAIKDFRAEWKITDTLLPVDWASVYWKRSQ
jgi:O-methyltransferase